MPDGQLTQLGLLGTAAFIGFFHTVTGPDHYIPFIAMAKVGRWSFGRTMLVTLACGVAHVLSSVVLGLIGVAASLAVTRLEWFEGLRGDLAAWLLLGFGLAYMVWGIRRAIRNRPHTHRHGHADGVVHRHEHTHQVEHTHVHAADSPSGDAATAGRMTPWILFTIFVFGPCEPLIPVLMYPALRFSLASVPLVAAVFAVCTIGTMLTIVAGAYWGLLRLSTSGLERYSHALAGLALAGCGGAMVAGL
jgi:ABC-type nickel/cobalt efflux system permease component RcnA